MRELYLQSISLVLVSDVEDEGGEDVEALAVAGHLVPAGVAEQHPLQGHSVLLILYATE